MGIYERAILHRFNKAVFFVFVYKITHSRQGDGLDGDRGLDDKLTFSDL